MSGLFITGVGTGVGKTLVTTILVPSTRRHGPSSVRPQAGRLGLLDDDPDSDPALILRSLGNRADAARPSRRSRPGGSRHRSRPIWRRGGRVGPYRVEDVVRFCREQRADSRSIRLIEGAGGVMSPIDVGRDLPRSDRRISAIPSILVTGTYLGALSHTLTALAALRGRDVDVRGIVVSESADSVGLADTVESLRTFGGRERPDLSPAQARGRPDDARWRSRPAPHERSARPDHA